MIGNEVGDPTWSKITLVMVKSWDFVLAVTCSPWRVSGSGAASSGLCLQRDPPAAQGSTENVGSKHGSWENG